MAACCCQYVPIVAESSHIQDTVNSSLYSRLEKFNKIKSKVTVIIPNF